MWSDFLKIYLFILRGRGECVCRARGRRRRSERIPSRLPAGCRVQHEAPSYNPEIMTWTEAKCQRLNRLSYPGTHDQIFIKEMLPELLGGASDPVLVGQWKLPRLKKKKKKNLFLLFSFSLKSTHLKSQTDHGAFSLFLCPAGNCSRLWNT